MGLPSGKYDIPIGIIDRKYKANGDLVNPSEEVINFFGDIIHLNGQPWPYLNVEPRKYRFRFLNSGLSRAYNLGFMVDAVNMTQAFQMIGSDGGLFSAPVTADTFTLSMGERYEVVFDFAGFEGMNLTLRNSIYNPEIMEFEQTDRLMRFVVGKKVTDTTNNNVPQTLSGPRSSGQLPPLPYSTTVDRTFNFARTNGEWTINGVTYNDVAARTLAKPPMGSIETWELRYAGGPGIHPIHMHLIDFMIVSRTGGRGEVQPYESGGLKDVVLLVPGETVRVTAFFGPWNGLYQFHCHNLIHEDHEMMDVFNTTVIKELGYDLQDTLAFDDPMDPRYAAKDYNPSIANDEDYITNKLLPSFVNSAAYRKLDEVIAAENKFYGRTTYGGGAPPAVPSGYRS